MNFPMQYVVKVFNLSNQNEQWLLCGKFVDGPVILLIAYLIYGLSI